MLRRIALFFLVLLLALPISSRQLTGGQYADIPPDDWTVGALEKATAYGLTEGITGEQMGHDNSMSRAAFVTALGNLFGWERVESSAAIYDDCGADAWYTPAVETAHANGVTQSDTLFRPEEPITREEMAVMLVKALGYERLAALEAQAQLPFLDVSSNRGYIAVACRFGLLGSLPPSDQLWFYPDAAAPREQAAAALVRTYERLYGTIDWLHGFYAFSSYSQIGLTDTMESVSVGWAMMDVDPETGPWLNQTGENGNSWVVPSQPELATDYFEKNGTSCHLSVFAGPGRLVLPDGTESNDLYGILATPQARTQAVQALVAAAGDYDGLTIDFEGLRAALKGPFVDFMTELRAALPEDKSLYVCVQPPDWYDGFDYRALGELCDKVILMAHDYQWTSVPEGYVGTTNTDTPVTPFRYVYTALRAITDPETGVQDKSRIALAFSIASAGLEVDEDGVLLGDTIYSPGPSTVITRLRQPGTRREWSEVYRNPYLLYTAENGGRYLLWYEDAQSVVEKVVLAQMFGIHSFSLWRLGSIPNYPDPGLHYDVWSALQARQ